jgi:hypothetical protein
MNAASPFTITLTSTESELPLANTDFHDWNEVDWALQRIAARAPQGRAYDKTRFTVVHNPTGRESNVRVDVQNLDHAAAPRLKEMLSECDWLLSDEGRRFLSQLDAEKAGKRLRDATFWREVLS